MSIYKVYELELNDKIKNLTEVIANGQMPFEIYKASCAKIQAYKEALEIFKNLVKNSYKDENYDDE